MGGFHTVEYYVTPSFAQGWPAILEAQGLAVDAEAWDLNGQVLTPLQTGDVMYGKGGVWLSVGLPPDDQTRWLAGGVPARDYERYVLGFECPMPSLFSMIFRRASDRDSKACFDKLCELMDSYGFVKCRPDPGNPGRYT
jgi:hypothetical protein